MPPVQKAFQIASICCLISPVSMVGDEETFISGGRRYCRADWRVGRTASGGAAVGLGGGRVELLHVLFLCQLSGMGRLRGDGGLDRAGGTARYVPGGCLAC